MNELTLLENTDIATLFDSDIEPILQQIKNEVSSFVPDTSTKKGRDELKSTAFKVVRSKTAIDSAGKELNAEIKAKVKIIDASRKKARDFLDDLAKEIRQPLTDYEKQIKINIENKKILTLHIEALGLNDLFNREKIVKEKEDKLKAEQEQIEHDNKIREEQKAQIELERIRVIDAEKRAIQAEKDKVELIKQQAIDEVNRKKQQEIDAENAEIARLEAVEKAEKDKVELIKQNETDKINAKKRLIEQQIMAEAEKARALKSEEARLKQVRIDKEAKAKANLDNVKLKNNQALQSLILENIDADIAKKIVVLIAQGKVANVEINY